MAAKKKIRELSGRRVRRRIVLKQAEVVFAPGKQLLSLRLDQDVVAWFRSLGDGYQTRMNAVLRSYMEHRRKKRAAS